MNDVRSKAGNLPLSIAQELRRQLLAGELRPGDRLPGHRELAVLFSVSVGSVREAISMLISSGEIITQAGRGTFVSSAPPLERAVAATQLFERGDIEQLIEAREVLEAEIAKLAAVRATPEQVGRLRACVERMRATSADADLYPEADVEFHIALAEAAGNRFLLQAIVDIRLLLRKDMTLGADAVIRRFGNLEQSVLAHVAVVEAVEARDPVGAEAALLAIIRRHHEFVRSLYALVDPMPVGEAPR